MNRAFLIAAVPCISLALCSCAPNLTENQTSPGARAMFDDTTGVIPLPSDLLKGPDGKLALPAQAGDSELTAQVKAALNDLDGWLTGSTITVPFDAPLDPATVTPQSVLLVDLGKSSEAPTAAAFADPYYALFNVGRAPASAAPYNIIVKTKSPGALKPSVEFAQGERYAVVVTDAVKGADGLPVITHAALDFLKSTTPLVDKAGHSTTILADNQAALLEMGRAGVVAPAFDAMEAKGLANRQHAVSYTVFSTQSGARPSFNPLLVGRILPTPNDVGTPANAALDVQPEVLFDLPYDPASVDAGTFMFKMGATPTPVTITTATSTTPNAKGLYSLKVVPSATLKPSTSYMVVLTKDIKSQTGVAAQPSVYFMLARTTTPILDESTTPPTLNSPFVDLTLDVLILLGKDPATATADDWTSAYGALTSNLKGLEDLRVAYSPAFDAAQTAGIARDKVIVLWTFTTAAQ